MATALEKISLSNHQVLFRQGDAADGIYKIFYGTVEIYLNYRQPNEKLLTVLHEGEYFGEMALIDETVRSATAVSASNETRVVFFPKSDIGALLKSDSDSFRELLSQMATNLRTLTGNYMNVCRTIAEYEKANDSNMPLSKELQSEMDKYAELYNKQ